MKLIIDIPDHEYKYTCERTLHDRSIWDDAIRKGTPLDDVKAEIKDLYVGYRHGYEIMADVLRIIDDIGKTESEEVNETL